jgi:hypothetical protein
VETKKKTRMETKKKTEVEAEKRLGWGKKHGRPTLTLKSRDSYHYLANDNPRAGRLWGREQVCDCWLFSILDAKKIESKDGHRTKALQKWPAILFGIRRDDVWDQIETGNENKRK